MNSEKMINQLSDIYLGVILIDYHSWERTVKYIKDIQVASNVKIEEIVVLDNSEDVANYNHLCSSFQAEVRDFSFENDRIDIVKDCSYEKIHLIFVKTISNLGFAKANNLGCWIIDCLTRREKKYDKNDINHHRRFVLISNSDIVFPGESLDLKSMINLMQHDKSILLTGPTVTGTDGMPQSPCKYMTIYDRYWRPLRLWPLNRLIFLKNKYDSEVILPLPNQVAEVYRVVGAFMLFDLDNFFSIDGFDENTFLFAEELILAEKAKSCGMKICYFPDVRILHEESFTIKKSGESFYRKIEMMLDSNLYYYREYIGVDEKVLKKTQKIVDAYMVRKKRVSRIMNIFSKY